MLPHSQRFRHLTIRPSWSSIVLMLAFVVFLPHTLRAQTPLPNDLERANPSISVDFLDAELAAIAAQTDLDEVLKAKLSKLLQDAKQTLQKSTTQREKAIQFEKEITGVADETLDLPKQFDKQADDVFEIDPAWDVTALSHQLALANADLQKANELKTKWTNYSKSRLQRLPELPAEISEAETESENVTEQLGQESPANESEIETSVRNALLETRDQELKSRLAMLKNEQAAYLATAELLPLRLKVATQRASQLNDFANKLQLAISAKKKKEAEESAAELSKATNEVPKQFRTIAERNLELAQKNSELITKSEQANKTLEKIQSAVEEVQAELKTSMERVKDVGLTDALGLMFRERKRDFETMRAEYRPRDDLQQKSQESLIESFKLEDELRTLEKELVKMDPVSVELEAKQIDWKSLSLDESEWVLLQQQQELLRETLQSQRSVLQTMLTSDTQRHVLSLEIDDYNRFVDQHLFWTRSAPLLSLSEFNELPKILRWVSTPASWLDAGSRMVATVQRQPVRSIALVVLAISLIIARSRFRRTITAEGKEANRFNATFQSTLNTLLATLASTAVWPVFFGVIGFLLLGTNTSDPFILGLGYAFLVVGIYVASRELLKETCRDGGLADAHFRWPAPVRHHFRRHLRWYTFAGGITIFTLVVFHEHPDTAVSTLALRFLSAALFLITALFHHVMLRLSSPIHLAMIRNNPESIYFRWRKAVWLVAVGSPVVFALMSIAGYLETTFRLGGSLQKTFLLLILVVLILGLVSRWLTLHRRDAARRRAMEQRQRRQSIALEGETGTIANEAGIVIEDESEADLPKLDHQTRQTAVVLASLCTAFALAYIWSDVLPALEYFNEVELWDVGTEENLIHVTLKDLIYSVVVVAVIMFFYRNFPALLELLVLSRTSLDAGARYALNTLMRYAMIVIGVIVVVNLLSIPYAQLGWLLAAASVGLGFGLQEIVANFVSGIILLLERPVRVGDVVTIDSTTGIVSRIQMRATTVTSWDRKELVIPNKDLITQKLLNWSLSNVVNRMSIQVGVAYGSDPDEVREILMQVVTDHPEIMNDPGPLINFETFGDSSLNFIVRFYLPKLDNRIEVTHQINTAIAHALEKAGINIPFPQRDLHIISKPDSE